jgi:hypothetical protein
MLRFAGAIHDAAHDGKLQLLDAFIAGLPGGHLFADVALYLLRHFLEEG